MRDGIRIGRLFGISLSLDYSWIFIFVLITWNLTAMFWHWHPAWGVGNLGLAIVASLLFFGSVVAHELGHALVATGYGIPVREIRLFLFGGVSDIEREPPSPGAELAIAIVGPAISFAIGIACMLVSSFFLRGSDLSDPTALLAGLGPVATIILWLGPINLVIAVFNLIPGFPLDGGRVLRAVLWRATGDLHRATQWASTAGQAIGWAFVLMGISMVFGARIPFFGQGAGSGLWLAFIGWFLSSAAARSYQGLLVHDVLEGVTVMHLMRRTGPVMPHDTTVEAATEWFLRTGEHVFPILRDGEFVGILCPADIRRASRETWSTTPVEAIMMPKDQLVTTTPSEEAATALRKLAERNVEQLPVVVDGKLAGMLERITVARWLEMNLSSPARRTLRTA
jgi:Zn-dependent protease/CBS domain-containing protein